MLKVSDNPNIWLSLALKVTLFQSSVSPHIFCISITSSYFFVLAITPLEVVFGPSKLYIKLLIKTQKRSIYILDKCYIGQFLRYKGFKFITFRFAPRYPIISMHSQELFFEQVS